MVEGGAGLATDVFGGGDNFVVGRDAPPEAVEFLKYLTTDLGVAERWVAIGDGTLPTVAGAEAFVTDPNLQSILAGSGRGHLRAGLPRPGDQPGAGCRHQRGRRRPGGRRPVSRGGRRRPSRRRQPPRREPGAPTIDRAGRRSRRPARYHQSGDDRWQPARRGPATRRWLTIALFLLPALVVYGLFVLLPIVQAAWYSLFDWNGLDAAHRLHRARQLHEGAQRLGLPERRLAQHPHRLPVPDGPDPVRALAGAPAQPTLPRAGRSCASCSSRRSCSPRSSRASSSSCSSTRTACVDRSLGTAGLGFLAHEWLADRSIVMLTMFVDHLVEVLRLPHDPHAGRPPGHPA